MAEIPNRTLQRGLEMLEILSAHPQGMALCDLTHTLNLPRSTAYNLLQTLVCGESAAAQGLGAPPL